MTKFAPYMGLRRIIGGFGLDTALWYCAPAAFMFAYVGRYAQPTSAVTPHLRAIALPLLLIFLLRLLLARLIAGARWRDAMAAVLTGSILAALLVYYGLVLVGLSGWGGVVTWDVVPTFFAQSTALADAIGIAPILIPIALALAYLGLIAACWFYLKHFDWIPALIRSVSGPTFAVLVACSAGILAVGTYQFSLGEWTQAREPLSLTLFPQAGALDLEGYSANPLIASGLDRSEEEARKAYVPAVAAHRNLILIVVDALRPDHMSVYGYDRNTTPNLDRLAGPTHARIISGVHSSCGDTVCGLFSLFSSRFPSGFLFHPFVLQEALRRNGYRIHMILSGDHTHFFGLRRFYGPVDSFYDGNQAHSYYLNDDRLVLDQLSTMPDSDGAPAMFQFHLMSAHILRNNDDTPGRFQPAVRYSLRNSRDTGPGGAAVPGAVNFYDNGVLHTDSIVDSLLRMLQTKGYLHDALVVITADHGESLGEHGLFTHANSVREELLRIPLVLLFYGYESHFPATVRDFPSQVDIAPTLLTELGLPLPRTWTGRPLQYMQGLDFSYFDEHAFAGLIDHRNPHHTWKYWIDGNSGAEHVYDLNVDPSENRDVRGAVPARTLTDWHARTLPAASVAVAGR